MSKNVVTLKAGSEVTQGHLKYYHSIECLRFPRLLVFYNKFVRKMRAFWDIWLVQWPWNPC